MTDQRILVASIPRRGSTMLFRALIGADPGANAPKAYDGPHEKTHSFNPSEFDGRIDFAIFLFRDVVESVASTIRKKLGKAHFLNCGAGHLNPTEVDLREKDYLNYEKMFDAWMYPLAFPHIAIRYEPMHDFQGLLSSIIQYNKRGPLTTRKPTRTSITNKDRRRIEMAYESLIQKVAAAPVFSYWHANA